MVYSVFGKILNLLWQNCTVFGQPFNAVHVQILKNNIAIWSHCLPDKFEVVLPQRSHSRSLSSPPRGSDRTAMQCRDRSVELRVL